MTIKSRKRRERAGDAISFALLAVFVSLVLFPLWWIFRSSLMTNPEIGSRIFLPRRWLVLNYADAHEVFDFFS